MATATKRSAGVGRNGGVARSNGVGAFGWTLLGFLAGVAATLAIQLIMVSRDREEEAGEPAHIAPVVAITPQLPAPKHRLRAATVDPATPAPQAAAAAKPPRPESEDQQMAEDAAATGMTARASTPNPGADPQR